MAITVDSFREFFNLYQTDITQSEFDRSLEIAKERFLKLLGLSTFPSVLTAIQEELIFHLILLEHLKKVNFLISPETQRFSINKVAEHIERLVWIIKAQMN